MTAVNNWNELDREQLLRLLAARTEGLSKATSAFGRGSAVGYTGAYHEAGEVDLEDVVAHQNARGPE
jgi:hypothetical protein